MPRRRCPNCTPSQRLQSDVSRPLTKVQLHFPTPLQTVFPLRLACAPPSFPPVGKPQSIVGTGSAQGECGGAPGKPSSLTRPSTGPYRHCCGTLQALYLPPYLPSLTSVSSSINKRIQIA